MKFSYLTTSVLVLLICQFTGSPAKAQGLQTLGVGSQGGPVFTAEPKQNPTPSNPGPYGHPGPKELQAPNTTVADPGYDLEKEVGVYDHDDVIILTDDQGNVLDHVVKAGTKTTINANPNDCIVSGGTPTSATRCKLP